VSGTRIHTHPVTTKAVPMSTAPAATMRAEVSLTGFGNVKKERAEAMGRRLGIESRPRNSGIEGE
jgi:hypothetical protein